MAEAIENTPDVEEMFYVGLRKYGLDASAPWWERWFFRAVYLPFVRLSFKWLHIPAQGTLNADGSTSWVEHIGIATDIDSAREMCKGEFYAIQPLPVNGSLPEKSVQYKGHIYPRAMTPGRYRRRVFRLTAVRSKEVAMLQDVDKQADRLLETARAG